MQLVLNFGPDEWAATVIVVVGYAVFLFFSKRARKRKAPQFFRDDNTPVELQRSSLYGSEQHISCTTPIALKGTYDQLYKTPDKDFIISDTKTRKKPTVYESDIIQLSAYRLILRNSRAFKNKTIRSYGYMRLVCNGVTHYKKVDLMSEQAVIDLYERRYGLYKGTVEPKKADTRGKCINCHQLANCGGVKTFKKKKPAKQPNNAFKHAESGWD